MTTSHIHIGDSRHILTTIPDNTIDSVVCDPPYELGFMGKSWDASGVAYDVNLWAEVLRVLKPGGHLLAFGGSRTYHRLACAIEDAGFEIRDQIMWVYGSGFPKSLDVSKAIDKAAGAERKVVASVDVGPDIRGNKYGDSSGRMIADVTAPATDEAREWQGWGTALKPAHEPIVVARKPLDGTVANNVLAYGVGGLNIDGCRVAFHSDDDRRETTAKNAHADFGTAPGGNNVYGDFTMVERTNYDPTGRWPANFIHDGSDEVLTLFPDTTSRSGGRSGTNPNPMSWDEQNPSRPRNGHDDSGSAARFFYCAKAGKKERNHGLDGLPERETLIYSEKAQGPLPQQTPSKPSPRANHHPTVKPIALMRYLVRLVTPPNGLVLDPFTGSGTTGIAAKLEHFNFIGIEQDPEYATIAQTRIQAWN